MAHIFKTHKWTHLFHLHKFILGVKSTMMSSKKFTLQGNLTSGDPLPRHIDLLPVAWPRPGNARQPHLAGAGADNQKVKAWATVQLDGGSSLSQIPPHLHGCVAS